MSVKGWIDARSRHEHMWIAERLLSRHHHHAVRVDALADALGVTEALRRLAQLPHEAEQATLRLRLGNELGLAEPVNINEAECEELRLVADRVDFGRSSGTLAVTIEGQFEGIYTASTPWTDITDDGHTEVNGDIGANGRFRIIVSWNLAAGTGRPHTRETEITDWGPAGVMIWPS